MTALVEANRKLGRHFFEAQDRLRGGPDPALCADDYQAVIGASPATDLAGHTGFAQGFYAGVPDGHHFIEQVIATEEAVVVRLIIKGTHSGNFFGIAASGKPVAVAAHVILHVKDGKVARLFGLFDEAGLLRQMGVLPS